MKIFNAFKRSVPAKLYRYVHKRQRRPTLPGGLVTMYDKSKLSHDEQIVMIWGGARDQRQAQEALDGYDNALDWITAQPRKQHSVRLRLLSWIRRALGVYEYDPLGKLTPPISNKLKVHYHLESED